ncbi:MAG: DNA repair protein RadA, partial [Candidatus Omnitrophica bacterium]|nr:DNA repair protein RadA [Candidatus Omnitrophota bacterium]
TIFVCQSCGAQSPRWMGKCPSCESWNSLVEEAQVSSVQESRGGAILLEEKPVLLKQIQMQEDSRMVTEMGEFDRVMGGGIVAGSVTLIGGDPGIGKSTLNLQMAAQLSRQGYRVLYVSGEESVKQTKMRADRLAVTGSEDFYIVNQIDLMAIQEYIHKLTPQVVVIDSIQVVYHPEITSSPGSVSQVRECASLLTHLAKAKGIALFIIGHVTKEGTIAGPRVLEHIVDTVLYFEGERYTSYRILRSMKNRFGSTNEMGVFEMTSEGLKEVSNPSEIFLSERAKQSPGSVVVPILEGTRPFLVEIQGLVSRSSFGIVRQKAQGFDPNRLAMLVAVLEKRQGLNLYDKDIFLNVVGGVRIMDPAADLAVSMAIASALLDKVMAFDTVVFGEVGLSSEVRSVSQIAIRIQEAEKLGFKKCILPQNNMKSRQEIKSKRMEIVPVATVQEALKELTG